MDPSCSDGGINGDVKMSVPSESASSVTISDVIAKFITRVHSIILDLLSSRTISFSSVPISSERIKSTAQAILDCLVNTHINSKYSSSPQTFLDFLIVPYFPFASLSEINILNSFTAKNTSELALKIRSSINDDNEVSDFLSFHILSQCEIISEIFPSLALETIVSKYTSLVASHNENDIISELFEEEMSGLGGIYRSDVKKLIHAIYVDPGILNYSHYHANIFVVKSVGGLI